MDYELVSLFCGAGGLDYGFQQAGFRTVLALDNCPDAVRTFNWNSKHQIACEADLSRLSPDDFLALVPSTASPVGLIGGPPCQGFSRGNAHADSNDPRNRLPFRYASLLAAANRKYELHFFVFENVTALAGQKHANRFSSILAKFRAAGFNLFQSELNASDFAVPQRRRRLFVVGLHRDIYKNVLFEFPEGLGNYRTVLDAISGLPQPCFFSRSLSPSDVPYHPNHWTMVPRSSKFNSSGSANGRSFRRLKWNDSSPTVAYGNREVHVHPDGGRRLSVLEAMLLQGFPRQYQITGTLSSQITQVSNAVPPPVAQAIAVRIKSLLDLQPRLPLKAEAVTNEGLAGQVK
ncbi:MAG: DNA cytosine methyltransferase [Candidatus Hydrogenedentes bacterium]|nr:DNA cytosine methyltransferase [Candidatus Hydrogenedentota bacterium]